MESVFQTKFGGEDATWEERGDCFRACLASIFELPLEGVPDFGTDDEDGSWYRELQAWLLPRNLCMVEVPFDKVTGAWGYAILGESSPRVKGGHAVVVRDRHVVHDPHPDQPSRGDPEVFYLFLARNPARCSLREMSAVRL